MNKIIVIGDIVVDLTLQVEDENKLRLGGIIHSCRSLWALDANYSVGYFSPQYLDEQILKYLTNHQCKNIFKLGNVIGAPYLFIINEAKEVGNQGYEFILRDEIKPIEIEQSSFKLLNSKKSKDVLLITGNYNLLETVKELDSSLDLHIDLANNINELNQLESLEKKFSTIFLSTSSTLFQDNFRDNFLQFANLFRPYTKKFILKENRGGSRAIDFKNNIIINIPSQTKPILHSVGVGDAYDAAYLILKDKYDFETSLNLASWIASEYASTTFVNDFKRSVQRILKSDFKSLISLGGTILPWEKRKRINIYIAAPDFDYINTKHIDLLYESLKYHNFSPRRPIKENGQLNETSTFAEKEIIFQKDMNLIDECQILIAVLLDNDPGTFIEVGISSTKRKPTFIYDPFNLAHNCMLTQIPDFISDDLDKIITEVFNTSQKYTHE